MATMIATTIKIPNVMPALNIPDIAAQELNKVERNKNTTMAIGFIFFIWMFLKNYFG